MKILYCICKFDFKCVDLVALLGVCSRKSLQCRLAACYFYVKYNAAFDADDPSENVTDKAGVLRSALP